MSGKHQGSPDGEQSQGGCGGGHHGGPPKPLAPRAVGEGGSLQHFKLWESRTIMLNTVHCRVWRKRRDSAPLPSDSSLVKVKVRAGRARPAELS